MFGGRLLQGLSFSTLGCFVLPFAKPSLFTGGGGKDFSIVQVSSESAPELVKAKPETFLKVLLSGKDEKDGLVFELNREEKEDGKWKLGKVTWKGKEWNKSWLLYYDHIRKEHSFIDKYEFGGRCGGYTVYWEDNKVCLVHGRVSKEEDGKWTNNFPKIRFDGWSSYLWWGRRYGTWANLPDLRNCSIKMEERKVEGKDSLIANVSCNEGSILKRIDISDNGGMVIDRR